MTEFSKNVMHNISIKNERETSFCSREMSVEVLSEEFKNYLRVAQSLSKTLRRPKGIL